MRDALRIWLAASGCVVEAAVGVAVHVDEPGRDDAAAGIDDSLARRGGQLGPNLDDRVSLDADVGATFRRARAIHQASIDDEKAARWSGARRRAETRAEREHQERTTVDAHQLIDRMRRFYRAHLDCGDVEHAHRAAAGSTVPGATLHA